MIYGYVSPVFIYLYFVLSTSFKIPAIPARNHTFNEKHLFLYELISNLLFLSFSVEYTIYHREKSFEFHYVKTAFRFSLF